MRNSFFVSNHIFQFGLSPVEFYVYCYLCRCRNLKAGGTCFPSFKTIATACGISKRSVSSAINRLEALSLICREKRHQGRRQTSNLYTLTSVQEMLSGGETSSGSPESSCTMGSVTDAQEINKQNELNLCEKEQDSFNNAELTEILENAGLQNTQDSYMRATLRSVITQMYLSDFIMVDRARISNALIRQQLRRITCDAVNYALQKVRNNSSDMSRESRYLMACLYTAINDYDIAVEIDVSRNLR